MPITLRELARAAGVSTTTASRVLSNSSHNVSTQTRERVLRLADEMGYRPNMAARSLRSDQSFTVGIMANDITSIFTPIIIRGIQDVLKDAGYFCVITSFDGDMQLQDKAIEELLSRGVDGIAFVESWQYLAQSILVKANKPYVFCERLFGNSIANSVITDNRNGARQATEHLVQLGHRRIGFINGPDHFYISKERLLGYRAGLASASTPFDSALVLRGDWGLESGYEATRHLLNLAKRPTAIFAGNDMMAIGAIYAIEEAGLRVPHDIAIVGYDDRPIATVIRPKLTTFTLPCYEMGCEAGKLLLSQIEGGLATTPELILQGQMIVRESCGAHLTPS
ncbi:MAG: LacI family DNA-binding transcriptional regulator [Anaerolineae bacterium]|nr:LacI family DNA-binding transcriptional regulator [Anaerolineae bacterium]